MNQKSEANGNSQPTLLDDLDKKAFGSPTHASPKMFLLSRAVADWRNLPAGAGAGPDFEDGNPIGRKLSRIGGLRLQLRLTVAPAAATTSATRGPRLDNRLLPLD